MTKPVQNIEAQIEDARAYAFANRNRAWAKIVLQYTDEEITKRIGKVASLRGSRNRVAKAAEKEVS